MSDQASNNLATNQATFITPEIINPPTTMKTITEIILPVNKSQDPATIDASFVREPNFVTDQLIKSINVKMAQLEARIKNLQNHPDKTRSLAFATSLMALPNTKSKSSVIAILIAKVTQHLLYKNPKSGIHDDLTFAYRQFKLSLPSGNRELDQQKIREFSQNATYFAEEISDLLTQAFTLIDTSEQPELSATMASLSQYSKAINDPVEKFLSLCYHALNIVSELPKSDEAKLFIESHVFNRLGLLAMNKHIASPTVTQTSGESVTQSPTSPAQFLGAPAGASATPVATSSPATTRIQELSRRGRAEFDRAYEGRYAQDNTENNGASPHRSASKSSRRPLGQSTASQLTRTNLTNQLAAAATPQQIISEGRSGKLTPEQTEAVRTAAAQYAQQKFGADSPAASPMKTTSELYQKFGESEEIAMTDFSEQEPGSAHKKAARPRPLTPERHRPGAMASPNRVAQQPAAQKSPARTASPFARFAIANNFKRTPHSEKRRQAEEHRRLIEFTADAIQRQQIIDPSTPNSENSTPGMPGTTALAARLNPSIMAEMGAYKTPERPGTRTARAANTTALLTTRFNSSIQAEMGAYKTPERPRQRTAGVGSAPDDRQMPTAIELSKLGATPSPAELRYPSSMTSSGVFGNMALFQGVGEIPSPNATRVERAIGRLAEIQAQDENFSSPPRDFTRRLPSSAPVDIPKLTLEPGATKSYTP